MPALEWAFVHCTYLLQAWQSQPPSCTQVICMAEQGERVDYNKQGAEEGTERLNRNHPNSNIQ